MSVPSDKHLAMVGARNIGRILIKCLLAAGIPPRQVVVCDIDPPRGQGVAAQFGVQHVSLTDRGDWL